MEPLWLIVASFWIDGTISRVLRSREDKFWAERWDPSSRTWVPAPDTKPSSADFITVADIPKVSELGLDWSEVGRGNCARAPESSEVPS